MAGLGEICGRVDNDDKWLQVRQRVIDLVSTLNDSRFADFTRPLADFSMPLYKRLALAVASYDWFLAGDENWFIRDEDRELMGADFKREDMVIEFADYCLENKSPSKVLRIIRLYEQGFIPDISNDYDKCFC